jgi:cystathionine beta-lyase family protein involved in aluminum resistance
MMFVLCILFVVADDDISNSNQDNVHKCHICQQTMATAALTNGAPGYKAYRIDPIDTVAKVYIGTVTTDCAALLEPTFVSIVYAISVAL